MLGSHFDDVLTAAQAGGEWAWRRLYESIAPNVRGYVAAHGAADPDDLTSEVLLQLVRGLPRFEGDEAAFRSWVFLIAHHRVIDEHRRTQRDQRLAERQPPRPATGPAEADALDRAVLGDWSEHLAKLSIDQRSVVFLRVIGGLSVDEVAGILDKRPGAVRVLQHRALIRLKDLLPEGVTL